MRAREALNFRGATDIADTLGLHAGDRVSITIEGVVGDSHTKQWRDGSTENVRVVDVDVSYGLKLLRRVKEGTDAE